MVAEGLLDNLRVVMAEVGSLVVVVDSVDSLAMLEARVDNLALEEVSVNNLVGVMGSVDNPAVVEVWASLKVLVIREVSWLVASVDDLMVVIDSVATLGMVEAPLDSFDVVKAAVGS